ncbi:MAG: hypothetical protein NC344_10510 [Bacteroidales bacterium]|nr:hypothetical protein [Bacteroidales bacterium]MCM1148236.1 hypothetical protein [Bacteroidales bacterium]MCM1206933.1 hypothetical protein [Bacillota bacterium]MCM1511187.1 hypothetical protein [Clostridium sp.]
MVRKLLTTMLLLSSISAEAQENAVCDSVSNTAKPDLCGIISNQLTHVPQSGACISMSNGKRVTTAWDGRYSITDTLFTTASITKRGFLTRNLRRDEFTDTLFLIPAAHGIAEVTVWGKRGSNARFFTPMSKIDAELAEIGGNLGFNALGFLMLAAQKLKIIPKPGEKRRKREEKHRSVIEHY